MHKYITHAQTTVTTTGNSELPRFKFSEQLLLVNTT